MLCHYYNTKLAILGNVTQIIACVTPKFDCNFEYGKVDISLGAVPYEPCQPTRTINSKVYYIELSNGT